MACEIEQIYRDRHPRSAARASEALATFPSGVTHDGRFLEPFPLCIERSQGAYKWDADENRLIDYWSGHGALLLGHGHPAVVAAVQAQMARGTHYGGNHASEVRWAELVQQLVPGAEQVRFTASGTEATMLALRLARAYTRKPTVIRFVGHFHGWHDLIMPGAETDDPLAGVLAEGGDHLLALPTDLAAVEDALATRDDVAAVILEPSGASYGSVPLAPDFLRGLRALTAARDVLLICDEIVTGFRVAPGGAQERAGVVADLTCLAKVLAGGLPGGAVTGRADVLRHLAFGDAAWNNHQKIRHYGTYNGNPLSAAAGVATLDIVATGGPCVIATARCNELLAGLNALFAARELRGWAAYGDASIFHILAGSRVDFPAGAPPDDLPVMERKRGGDKELLRLLRLGLLTAGVDLMRGHRGFLTAAHTPEDIAATIAAFGTVLDQLPESLLHPADRAATV